MEPGVEHTRRVVVVLNPKSGRGEGSRRRPELERLLEQEARRLTPASAEWEIVETTGPASGADLACEAASSGADVVAGAGGDGTLHEIGNGLMRFSAANMPGRPAAETSGVAIEETNPSPKLLRLPRLGVIPVGTGNDFSRALGIGTDLSLAVRTLFHGAPRALDLGKAQDRYFLNVAGCGFDAAVADRINRGFGFLRGRTAYLAAVVETLIRYRAAPLRLTIDGKTHEMRAMLCSVANATSYGGGMKIAPDAKIDDGLFDLCILREAGRIEFLSAFPRVFRGTHVTHPKVTMLRARIVKIESESPLPILMDGEIVGTTPVEFTLLPHVLEVMTPTAG